MDTWMMRRRKERLLIVNSWIRGEEFWTRGRIRIAVWITFEMGLWTEMREVKCP
jgi:hypothetical protein